MQTVTIEQIVSQLRKLPAEKLKVVYEFVSYLTAEPKPESGSESEKTTLVDKEGYWLSEPNRVYPDCILMQFG